MLELYFQACSWQTCCQNCRKAYGVLQEVLEHAANLQGTLLELNFKPSELHCCEEDDDVVCLKWIVILYNLEKVLALKRAGFLLGRTAC